MGYEGIPYIKKKTELFILPLVCENEIEFLAYVNKDLYGVFINDTNKPQWENKVILVYNNPRGYYHAKNKWEKSQYKYQTYFENIDGMTYYIMSFVIPPKFKKDVEKHIMCGYYSKVSDSYRIKLRTIMSNSFTYREIIKPSINITPGTGRNNKGEIQNEFNADLSQTLNLNKVPINKGA